MLTLNVLVQTQMMLNAPVTQNRQLSRKTQKKTTLHKLVLADRTLNLREIAGKLMILEDSVFTILHEHLTMRKLCSKWMQRLLTVDQKQQRVNDSEHCLQLFKCNKKEFLRKYLSMDETWIHDITLE